MLHRAFLLFLALVLPAPIVAQPSPNIRIAAKGPWVVDCSPEPQTGEKWCQVGAVLQSDSPPYALQFNYVRDSRMFFAMGSVPLSTVRAQVDNHPVFTLDRCLAGMCMTKGAPAENLLAEMRAGGHLVLQFESRQRLPGPLTVDLADFEAMYRAALAAPR